MPASQKEERGKCCGWRSILTFYGHYQSMSHSQFLVIQTSFSGLAWLIEWNPDEIRTASLPMAACIDVSTSDILSTTAFYSLVSVITFTHNISNWFHHWITSQKRTTYFEWTIYISIPLVQVVITFPFLKRVLVSQKINGFNFDNFNHIYHIYLTYMHTRMCIFIHKHTYMYSLFFSIYHSPHLIFHTSLYAQIDPVSAYIFYIFHYALIGLLSSIMCPLLSLFPL